MVVVRSTSNKAVHSPEHTRDDDDDEERENQSVRISLHQLRALFAK